MEFRTVDDIARRLASLIPPGLRDVQQDLEQQFQSVLKTAFERMDLVTREEFEVQQKILLRSREKLEALEARLEAMTRTQRPDPNSATETGSA